MAYTIVKSPSAGTKKIEPRIPPIRADGPVHLLHLIRAYSRHPRCLLPCAAARPQKNRRTKKRMADSEPQLALHRAERLDRQVEVGMRMGRRNLGANAGFSLRHDRIRKADDVDPLREHGAGEFRSQARL